MTKNQYLKKVFPMAVTLLILIGVAFSCSAFTGKEKTPSITNPGGDFVTLGDVSLSNEEVYHKLINQFGASEVRQYIDFELLTKGTVNYLELAKNDVDFNIDEMLEKSIYNGITLEEAQMTYTNEYIEELTNSFEDRLVYNGYVDLADFKNDLYLEHARGLFAKDELISQDEITMTDLGIEYEENFYSDACLVVVIIPTDVEAKALLEIEGLEVDEFGEFIGNPTDSEVLQAYVNIYNTVYGNRPELTYSNGSILECGSEELTYNFDELQDTNPELAPFYFRILDTNNTFDSDTLTEYKTYSEPVAFVSGGNTNFYLAYKISGENQNDFTSFFPELSSEEFTDMLETLYSENTSSDLFDELFDRVVSNKSKTNIYITTELQELLDEKELTIYDKYLKFNFDSIYGTTLENNGSKDIVFSFLDVNDVLQEVTADMFFDQLAYHAAPVAINLLNAQIALVDEDLFDAVITDELVAEVQAQVTDYKRTFQQNGYVEYGYDNTEITWDEFIYSAFQYRSEKELYNAILTSNVVEEYKINLFTSDEIQEIYYDLMAEEYENAFELSVKHFLVFADNNEDGVPDLVNDTNWTSDQRLLAAELIDLLRVELQELNVAEEITLGTLKEIETEYMEASYINDDFDQHYSKWAKFKLAGLRLTIEDLGNVTAGEMVGNFEAELKMIYDEFVEENLFTIISENNVETEFGYHLIYSDQYYEKGDAYPEDAKVFPSRLDITAFNNNEFDELTTETLLFIGQYYTPVTNEYIDTFELVLFDDARSLLGQVVFANQSVLEDYNDIVRINRESSIR